MKLAVDTKIDAIPSTFSPMSCSILSRSPQNSFLSIKQKPHVCHHLTTQLPNLLAELGSVVLISKGVDSWQFLSLVVLRMLLRLRMRLSNNTAFVLLGCRTRIKVRRWRSRGWRLISKWCTVLRGILCLLIKGTLLLLLLHRIRRIAFVSRRVSLLLTVGGGHIGIVWLLVAVVGWNARGVRSGRWRGWNEAMVRVLRVLCMLDHRGRLLVITTGGGTSSGGGVGSSCGAILLLSAQEEEG